MQNEEKDKRIKGRIALAIIVALCALTLLLEFLPITYVKDEFRNRMLSKIIQQACGVVAAILLMLWLRIRLFGKVQNWLYFIPCLIIAIDNFQFSAYFQGEMRLVRKDFLDFLLFAGYCLTVGLFEELVFRGIVFSIFVEYFSKDKKGFLLAYVVSSVIFGFAHLLNGISGATLLQVGYSILTGGLFAFCLIKTKNIFCCAVIHGIYNFGGMLFDKQGLGSGVVFDVGTIVTMLVVSVCVGIFVLYSVWKYSDKEREELYGCLGVRTEKSNETEEKSL